MRKINAVLTALIMVLFLIHGIMGALQLAGIGNTALKPLAWVMTGLIALHMIIGIKLTADTIKLKKTAGVSYPKENRLFWARRLSGFAIFVFMLFHITAFGINIEGAYRLKYFGAFRLTTQIFLVLSIALHVITNVKPMLIAFGIRSLKERAADILFVLSIIFLIMGAAFIIYYLRWNIW